MFLREITLVNWANIPRRTITLSQAVMVSGPAAAGKTTILDAIQTLMTAGLSSIIHYNPGQDEVGQRSKQKITRSLASYVLGADENLASRPNGAVGYIIGYFVPGPGESGKPFSALLGTTAYYDHQGKERTPRNDEPVCLLVREQRLGLDDVIVRSDAGRENVVTPREILSQLQVRHIGAQIEISRNRSEFLALLYGALSGQPGAINHRRAQKAARQLVRFMVYRPIESLDDFVRNDILDPVDLSQHVEEVSTTMREIQDWEQRGRQIREGIDCLEGAQRETSTILEVLCEQGLWDFEEARRAEYRGEQRLQEQREAFAAAKVEHETAFEDRTKAEERIRRLTDRQNALQQQIQGHDVLRTKDNLEKQRERERHSRDRGVDRLRGENAKRHTLNGKLRALLDGLRRPNAWQPEGEDWPSLVAAAVEGDSWKHLNLERLIQAEDFNTLLEYEGSAHEIEDRYAAVIEALSRAGDSIERAYLDAKGEERRVTQDLEKLKAEVTEQEGTEQVPYPPHTRMALEMIRESFPQANPRVLCDYVEVTDPEWQWAIEGLFGFGRYMILVEPQWEASVLRLIADNRARVGRATVAQAEKARRDLERNARAVHEDSIVHLMRFSDPLVERVVKALYGPVRQVEDAEALRFVARGLTKDGKSSGGYQMRVIQLDESELVFGREARAQALKLKRKRIEQLAEECDVAGQRAQARRRFFDVARDVAVAPALSDALEQVSYVHVEIEEIERKLRSLDVSEHQDLIDQYDALETERQEVAGEVTDLNQRIGGAKKERERLEGEIEDTERKLEGIRGWCRKNRAEVDALAAAYPGHPWEERLAAIEAGLDAEEHVVRRRQDDRARARLIQKVADFNALSIEGLRIELGTPAHSEEFDRQDELERHVRILRDVRSRLGQLSNDLLGRNLEKLEEANRRFNEAFVTDVCLTMHNQIRAGRDTLETLNEQLRKQSFGGEVYRFDFDWNPEFEEYAHFFTNMVRTTPSDVNRSLFEDEEFTERDREIFERLRTLLLSEDVEKSRRELSRLTDYRQYRNYDVIKQDLRTGNEVSMRRYGTGSGAQMETPSYIIRSAALGSALGWSEGDTHLRFVMIDESFAKMDEQRCHEVIRYLTEGLGLQMLFVIPNKSAGPIYSVIDKSIQVTKLPSTVKRGELDTQVYVDERELKPDRIQALLESEVIQAEQEARREYGFLDVLDESMQDTAQGR